MSVATSSPVTSGPASTAVTLTRAVAVPPELALAALGQVLRAAPFGLSFAGTHGGHPLQGGVLRFVVPASTGLAGSGSAWAPVGADVARRTVDVSLVATSAASTDIRVSTHLPRARALALLGAALDAVARHAISASAFGPPPIVPHVG